VAELDAKLRKLDPNDPVKYDFALFGLGVLRILSNNTATIAQLLFSRKFFFFN
jgi:hypothetical protein